MPRSARTRLLFGPYRPPRLRKGARASCLYRDCDVIVTGWTDARITWPRCWPVEVPHAHPSLLVDEELARAVRSEATAAVGFWWGVGEGVVCRWRKALGVTKGNNPGTIRLVQGIAQASAAATRRRERTDQERGPASDEEVAKRIGKTRAAVRVQRGRRKVPST
jgi:hypothetical protein